MNVTWPGFGCGDFQITALDGTKMWVRSMEFPFPQNPQIIVFNRGEKIVSKAPDGAAGFEFITKHGQVGFDAFGLGKPVDGLNEVGFGCGLLTLDETTYQTVSKDQENQALSIMDVTTWLLGCFATVAEAKEGIKNVRICEEFIKPLNRIPGLHIALHDADGNNGVIEIIDGHVNFYENPIGVLTNDPPLPQQLENLKKYLHLIPVTEGGEAEELPGGWSSESRFVRLWYLSHCAKPQRQADALEACTHILNATDIPSGAVIVKIADKSFAETTLWSTIKNLKERKIIYRTHKDMTDREIDLN